MRDTINEILFYIIECILIGIIAIHLSFTYHKGSILLLFLYAISLSIVFTLCGNVIIYIDNKLKQREIDREYEEYEDE